MINWGISAFNHDASIASVEKDKILFAGHAERYSRIKNDPNLNDGIIEDALSYGEPDVIHWYESPILKNLRRLHAGQKWNFDRVKTYLKGTFAPFERDKQSVCLQQKAHQGQE